MAKVLKVVKDNGPYGDKLVKIGKLITTDHHPIKHRGKWYVQQMKLVQNLNHHH